MTVGTVSILAEGKLLKLTIRPPGKPEQIPGSTNEGASDDHIAVIIRERVLENALVRPTWE